MYAPVPVEIDGCRNNKWGFLATDVKDAPTCVMACRDKFWMSLVPNDETFGTLCRVLSAATDVQRAGILHSLYCCDAQLCGVDNIIGSQRDPNVNWLVSNCQSLGFSSILDPGPPGIDSICSTTGSNFCSAVYSPIIRSTITSPRPTSTPSTLTASIPSLTMTVTSATTQPTPSFSRIRDPSLNSSTVGTSKTNDTNSLSSESKITIVLIVSVICIAIFIALVFILYRRNKGKSKKQQRDQQLLQNVSPSPPGHASPINPQSPLCSPALSSETRDGVPLTPPPRLQQRRYLSSQSSQGSPVERISRRTGFHVPMTLRSTNKSPDEPTRTSLDAILATPPSDFTPRINTFPPNSWTVSNNDSPSIISPIRPEEIGVAKEFPPPHEAVSQISPHDEGEDSPPSRRVLSTIMDERDLEMLGGTYRQAK